MSQLEPFGPGIWTMDGDEVRLYGIPFPTRMTVVRLEPGALWLHSPVAPTDERRAAVAELGRVEHLVAPNKIHSLGIEPWKKAYPNARVWVSPGFPKRHPEIVFDSALEAEPPPDWHDELAFVLVRGSIFLDELVFLHRPSRTLIVTDLVQRHAPEADGWFWRNVKRVAGVSGESGGTALDLRASFRDRAAARASLEQILGWDFDRLVISHGECARENAKAIVRRAFEWLC